MLNGVAAGLILGGWIAWLVSGDASLGLMFIATLIALNGQPWKKNRTDQ